ncbi:MAG: SusD/RagB family nutrient-binding outer membrane lipoprotein [Carboxylicivirga sp.]|jgi:hypothetical protein|nr:SusD/RagB family nutrient-binding outer membrane lipoprotein [Carboxylicivirga sp.]
MKNIIVNKLKNSATFALIILLTIFSACTDDFEEMNKHPFEPTETSIPPVFNRITQSLMLEWQERAGLHNTYYYYYSQQAGRFGISGYLLDASINDVWQDYYKSMGNYRLLEQLFEDFDKDLDLTNVQAMSKILIAYNTLRMVEMFGDLPFENAGYGKQGAEYFRAPYDNDVEIHKQCLTDLKWASDNLTEHDDTKYSIGDYDVLFKSDHVKWKKWANSLILRYSLHIYDQENQFAGDLINTILSSPGNYPLIEAEGDVCLWPEELDLNLEGRGWSFWSENMLRMGTAMWSIMSDNDDTDGNGIFDPRCYVFFEPNDNDEWVAYPQNPSASTPVEIVGKAYHRDRDDDWNDKGGINYSPFNYFLVRDQYDVPEIIQTAAEVKLLKAEAYAKGTGVGVDLTKAQQEYEAALRTSIDFWYYVVSITDIWTVNVPTEPTEAEVDAFIAHPKIAWDNSKAMELVYTQRWVDAFRQPWEGFNLWNYTNLTPRDMSGNYNASDYEFYRIHYPLDERKYNKEYWSDATNNGADDREDVKLFWHK